MWMPQTHHNHTAHIHLVDACHEAILGIFCISKHTEKCVHTSYAQLYAMCLNLSYSVFTKPVKRAVIGNLY